MKIYLYFFFEIFVSFVNIHLEDGKRNIQSLKNSIKGRKKREIGGENEFSDPVFQNGPVDYDELLQALNDDFPYAEKRFLGM